MASTTSPTAAPCGVCGADRSRCERRFTRSSMAVSLRPLRGTADAFRRSAIRCAKEAQFAELVKFCYLWDRKSISYKGGGDGEPVLAGIDHPPVACAGRSPPAQVGHRGGQATAPHPARGHAADSQPAGAGRPAPDPAHRRRHAADRCRARGARAQRAHRSRHRNLRDLAGDDRRQNRRAHLDRRRQHRKIFRAVRDLRIFQAVSERRHLALDRQPAGDRHGACAATTSTSPSWAARRWTSR